MRSESRGSCNGTMNERKLEDEQLLPSLRQMFFSNNRRRGFVPEFGMPMPFMHGYLRSRTVAIHRVPVLSTQIARLCIDSDLM